MISINDEKLANCEFAKTVLGFYQQGHYFISRLSSILIEFMFFIYISLIMIKNRYT